MNAAEASLRDLLLGKAGGTERPARSKAKQHIAGESRAPTPSNTTHQVLLRELLDHVQPLYVAGSDGTLIAYSRAFAEIHNELFSGSTNLSELIDQVRNQESEVRRTDVVTHGTAMHRYISRHFQILDDGGELVGFGGVYDDISELANATHKAGEVENWLQDVIRSSSDWIWGMDQNSNLVFASSRISEFLDEPVQSVMGRHLFSFGDFDAHDELAARTRQDIEQRAPFRGRVFLLSNRRGQLRHILLSGVPVFDDSTGAFRGYRGTGTDITSKVEAENLMNAQTRRLEETYSELLRRNEELRIAMEHAKVADKAKLDFLAMMSHELKTPLNCIIGFSDAAMQNVRGPVGPAYGEYFESIHKAGQHLLAIINDLLDSANLERSDIAVRIGSEPVQKLIEEAVSLVDFSASRNKLDLDSLKPKTDLVVKCDHLRARQIIVNLIANALKFTPDGGKVGVDVSRPDEGMVAITVWDTGIGIPLEQQARVFEKFYQVEQNVLSRGVQGTGLGLNISRHLARLMGGDLALASVPGKGSRFTLTLPDAGNPESRNR
ncbi:MAG: PAS domain-containing sensor histidine kinase [Alphaproteobacteria bacterium]